MYFATPAFYRIGMTKLVKGFENGIDKGKDQNIFKA